MWSRAKCATRWGRRQGPQAFGIRRPPGSGVRVNRGVLLGGSGVRKDLPPEVVPCRQVENFGPAGAPCGVRERVWGGRRTALGSNWKTIAFLKETEGFWRSRKVRGGPKIAPKRSLGDVGGVKLVPWERLEGPWGSHGRLVGFSGARFWVFWGPRVVSWARFWRFSIPRKASGSKIYDFETKHIFFWKIENGGNLKPPRRNIPEQTSVVTAHQVHFGKESD